MSISGDTPYLAYSIQYLFPRYRYFPPEFFYNGIHKKEWNVATHVPSRGGIVSPFAAPSSERIYLLR